MVILYIKGRINGDEAKNLFAPIIERLSRNSDLHKVNEKKSSDDDEKAEV